jgi:hypothetical protein
MFLINFYINVKKARIATLDKPVSQWGDEERRNILMGIQLNLRNF